MYEIRCLTRKVSRLLLAVPMILITTAVYAGIGIGVSPTFPSPLAVGDTGVAVSLTFTNTSTTPEDAGTIAVTGIVLAPSCGDTTSPCIDQDLGVFVTSPGATGSSTNPTTGGCDGVNFLISAPDANGEVTFTPSAPINLSLFQSCLIDFTVDVVAMPAIDANILIDGTQTNQTARVSATSNVTQLPGGGIGTNQVTIIDCNVSIDKCVVVDTNGDGSLDDETCAPEGTSVVGALAEWRIVVTDDGPGSLQDCSLDDDTLPGFPIPIDLSSGSFSTEVEGECLDPSLTNTATVTCNACDGVADLNVAADSATLLCEECNVQVDKQVSCDGGNTWHDVGLVMDQAGDAIDPCKALGTDPIYVQYQVANPNTACDLSNCALTETNPTFGVEPGPFDIPSSDATGLEPGDLTPACEPASPFEPNLITVNCDTEYGTTVDANDDAFFECQDVCLEVDRNVDCGGGPVDNTLVTADQDGQNDCTTLDGNDVNWGYQASNCGEPGDAPLYACTLVDANVLSGVSDPIDVGTLNPGDLFPYPATGNPIQCSSALQANEDLSGQVTLTCCVRDVDNLVDCAPEDREDVFDRSTVICEPVLLGIVKECVDADGDGADEAVKVTVTSNASTNEPYYTNCDVTDTFFVDNDCASGPTGAGSDVVMAPDNYPLGSNAMQMSTGDLFAFTTLSCNTASVTCDGPDGPVTRDAVPVDCSPPGQGCLHRTPGFWGNRPVTTAAYLNVEVCGTTLDNVDWGDDHSAIEAICSVGKDHKILGAQETQLIRQCTAAALNFAVSADEGGSCGNTTTTGGSFMTAVMDACCDESSACTGDASPYTVEQCIGLVDYFNNDDDTLSSDVFTGLGKADSRNCRKSRNNGIVVEPND